MTRLANFVTHSASYLLTLLILVSAKVHAAPGDIIYQNSFSNNGDVNSDWSRVGGNNGNDFQAANGTFISSPRSLRIRDEAGGISDNGLINANVAGAEISFWLRQGSPDNAPESGENLILYYYNDSGSRVQLASYSGSDAAGTIYTPTINLPADALHSNLRFEFDMIAGGDNDRWFVDDFTVTERDAQNLLVHLQFDEGTGQTTGDTSSFNRNVILGNSNGVDSQDPTWQCEASGHYMSFDRSGNQHLEVASFTPPAVGTVAFWMRVPSSPSARQRIFGFGDGWEARWESGDRRIYWDVNKAGGNGTIRTANAVTEVDQWVHFAFTTNANTGDWAVYKNGVLENSGNESLNAQPAAELYIGGSRRNPTSEHFTGDLEDFRLYNGILSATEISALASSAPVAIDCVTEPIVNYQFDECRYTGSTGDVIDQTGNFNATSHGLSSPIADTVINRSLDLTINNTSDWLHVPSNAIHGLDSLTLSLWFKTDVNKSQQEIFQALGSSLSDDEFEVYLKDDDEVIVKIKDTSTTLTSAVDFDDNNWYHMVITRSGDDVCLYINSNLQDCDGGQNTGALSVTNANAVVIGQEQDSFGGSFSTSQNFEGQLDELKIFEGALSAVAIQDIYNNENAGLNFDGETRAGVTCSPLLALYSFEQDDFTTNILDTSTQDNHGSNNGGIKTDNGRYCRAFDSNGENTSTTVANAFTSSLDLDSDVGIAGTISFWFSSNTGWTSSNERTLFDASCNSATGCGSAKYFTLEITPSGRLRFSFEDSRDADFTVLEPSVTRLADTWYYISVTWDFGADRFRIYVDGNQVASSSANTNGQIIDFGNLVFGDNSSTYVSSGSGGVASPNSTNGKYDEVRVYSEVLTQAEIQADMDKGTTCVTESYRLSHDGNGLTCLAEPVNIIACQGGDCTCTDGSCIDTSINTTIDLIVTNLADGGDSQTISVPITNGVGSANFNYANIGAANRAILSSSSDYQCENTNNAGTVGQDNDICGVTFSDTAFVFSAIDNQVAGVGFNGVQLQALQANADGLCSALISGNTDVELAMQYQAPIDATVNEYTVGSGASAETLEKFAGTVPDSFSSTVNLSFDATGTATLPVNVYDDAGQIALHANLTIDATADTPEFDIKGNSNSFWVRPFELTIEANVGANSAAPDYMLDAETIADSTSATPNKVLAAGLPFNLIVKAVNADGLLTTNYEPHDNQIAVQRLAPTAAGTVDGSFTYPGGAPFISNGNFNSIAFSIFSPGAGGGISTATAAEYSELGIISIDVRDEDYGGVADFNIEATPITVGRFIPSYFKQDIANAGKIIARDDDDSIAICGARNWVYSGQLNQDEYEVSPTTTIGAIRYATGEEPRLRISAYNADNVRIRNYFVAAIDSNNHSFNRLLKTGVSLTSPTSHHNNNVIGVTALTPLDQGNANFADEDNLGVIDLHYVLSPDDHFTYEHSEATKLAPFAAGFDIVVNSITDQDGVVAGVDDLMNVEIRDSADSDLMVHFGRLVIDNSYGPEIENLAQRFYVESINTGGDFSMADFDNCTRLMHTAAVPNILKDHPEDPDTDFDQAWTIVNEGAGDINGTVASGLFLDFFLGASGAGNIGQVGVGYQTPPWLLFDWDNDGNHDDNARAIATFGRYRGNDRIIYWKEVNN